MRPKTYLTLIFILLLAAGLTGLVSCGGGGGGGGGGLAYTGVTTQAQITGNNALDLAVGTWNTVNTGPSIDILGAVQATSEFQKSPLSLGTLPFIFEDAVRNMDIASLGTGINLGAVQSVNETITGACNDDNTIAGGVTISGSVNDATGAFNLTANFNNYCEYEQGGK
jgi:hypothetical protein